MTKIKVIVAEDHTIVRKGLCSLLECEDDIEVVAEAKNGREVIKKIEHVTPDVVVMDIGMPGLNGIETTLQLKKTSPDLKVVILTMHSNEEYILAALQAGASGYLVKQTAPNDLTAAIRAAYRGDSYLSPSISHKVIKNFIKLKPELINVDHNYEKLTTREREVLQLIAEGMPNRKIAEILCISPKTVEAHKMHIQDKISLRGTAELTKYAIQKGLICLDC